MLRGGVQAGSGAPRGRAVVVAVSGADADGGKAPSQGGVAALAPGDPAPSVLWQGLMASALAGTGAGSGSRRIKDAGRPRPLQGFGGKGSAPGGHRLVEVWMPTT